MLSSPPGSPPRQQKQISHETPVYSKSVHSSSAYQSGSLEDARTAVLEDLGPDVPQIKFEDFMKSLAPPMPAFDLDATMNRLRSGRHPVVTALGRWKAFEKEPKEQRGKEDVVFKPIPIIFDAIVKAIIAGQNSNLTANSRSIDFVQNPNMTLTSTQRNNLTRPDGYMLLKSRRGEEILWADVVLSCEYKKNDAEKDLDDDVRKCIWSMQHVMRDDPCRRATFGLTIENAAARVWFCCRSVVVVSEAFDFINKPEALVQLFAAFAFADRKSLGYDPTMERTSGIPSQLIITVHSDKDIKKKERKFKILETISSYGAEPLRGRGTRVFRAIEIDSNGEEEGSEVVLKDIWINSDRMREGAILEELYNDAGDKDKELVQLYFLNTVCHGDVLLTEPNIVDDTKLGLMRGLELDDTKLFILQLKQFVDTTHRSAPGLERLRQVSRIHIPDTVPKYAHKTHYRIVFKEKGTTVDKIETLPEVLETLSGIVKALQLLRRLGWVHRDVSTGNILSCNGQAKLSDLEYAKKVGNQEIHDMRTGTIQFMSVEAAARKYLFSPTRIGQRLEQEEQDSESVNLPSHKVAWSHNHLHDLESLWWVAVWIVFFNKFSKPDQPDVEPLSDLEIAKSQLLLARTIFPLVIDSRTRQNVFCLNSGFQDMYKDLPDIKQAICKQLEAAREELRFHYQSVESSLPDSVNPEVSDDDIYNKFGRMFDRARKDAQHSVVLKSIPEIYTELKSKSR